jgi:6-phosphogluconate dehydrogenase (decarboxylating)
VLVLIPDHKRSLPFPFMVRALLDGDLLIDGGNSHFPDTERCSKGLRHAVALGWAHGASLTTFQGNMTLVPSEQVRAFAQDGSARIQW